MANYAFAVIANACVRTYTQYFHIQSVLFAIADILGQAEMTSTASREASYVARTRQFAFSKRATKRESRGRLQQSKSGSDNVIREKVALRFLTSHVTI